jgi:hypothetical protein
VVIPSWAIKVAIALIIILVFIGFVLPALNESQRNQAPDATPDTNPVPPTQVAPTPAPASRRPPPIRAPEAPPAQTPEAPETPAQAP